MKEKEIFRIVDANLNRLREGLRVCEDISRFAIEEKGPTAKLKSLRHRVLKTVASSRKPKYSAFVLSRDSKRDIGKASIPGELKRDGAFDVLSANLQRAKESARVLEELFKLINKSAAADFKKMRFEIYNIEKRIYEKYRAAGNSR